MERMEPLVKLVSQYRGAKDLSQRIRLSELLASAVGPHVQACLLREMPVEKAERVFLRAVRWIVFRLDEFHGKTDRAFRSFCRRVVQQKITQPTLGRQQADETLPEQLWQTALRDDDEDQVVELVRQYQATYDLSYRTKLAEEILQRVSPLIRQIVCSEVPGEEGKDVVQKTLVGIVDGLLRFDKDTTREFRGYCCGIARHKIIDAKRKLAKRRSWEAEVEDPWLAIEASAQDDPLSPADRIDLKDCLHRLHRLKPLCFHYLWNYYILGLDHGEIAKFHGTSPDGVRMHIKRCLKLASAMLN